MGRKGGRMNGGMGGWGRPSFGHPWGPGSGTRAPSSAASLGFGLGARSWESAWCGCVALWEAGEGDGMEVWACLASSQVHSSGRSIESLLETSARCRPATEQGHLSVRAGRTGQGWSHIQISLVLPPLKPHHHLILKQVNRSAVTLQKTILLLDLGSNSASARGTASVKALALSRWGQSPTGMGR